MRFILLLATYLFFVFSFSVGGAGWDVSLYDYGTGDGYLYGKIDPSGDILLYRSTGGGYLYGTIDHSGNVLLQRSTGGGYLYGTADSSGTILLYSSTGGGFLQGTVTSTQWEAEVVGGGGYDDSSEETSPPDPCGNKMHVIVQDEKGYVVEEYCE